jgi:hypothetical protein
LYSAKLTSAGDVAYWAASTNGGSGMYRTNGNTIETVMKSGYPFQGGTIDNVHGSVAINDSGTVVFGATYHTTTSPVVYGLYSVTSTGTVTRVSHNNPSTYFYAEGVDMNNQGDVVYTSYTSTYEDVYLYSAGSVKRIFYGGGYHLSPSLPEINNSDMVGFSGRSSNAGEGDEAFVYDAGQVMKIDTAHGDVYGPVYFQGYIANASVNDLGQVAYVKENTSYYDTDVLLYENGQYTKLVTGSAVPAGAELNNLGEVAFNGINLRGFLGILSYSDGSTADVLGYGYALFGRVVKSVDLWDINDRGQIALTARFTDGTMSLVIANRVPEPTSVQIVLAGCLLVMCIGRRDICRQPPLSSGC